MQKSIEEYKEYVQKTGSRLSLYRLVTNEYDIQSAIYPGSHIDIDPSLVIKNVTYIDNFKGAIKFFKNNVSEIRNYFNNNKEYDNQCIFSFFEEDYTTPLDIEKVDLIISQYAGFVSQSTKKYLKTSGILLCNDSHGDATLAKFDDEFELIGVIEDNSNITKTNLDEYFKLKNNKKVDLIIVKRKMKGFKYLKNANNYIFRKR